MVNACTGTFHLFLRRMARFAPPPLNTIFANYRNLITVCGKILVQYVQEVLTYFV